MIEINVNTILEGIILFIVGLGVKGIFNMKKNLENFITSTKVSIAKLETWTESHERFVHSIHSSDSHKRNADYQDLT